jgi:hypothetical protein
MIWAMALVVAVGALGAVVLERDLTLRRDEAHDLERLAALHAVDGGLDHARHRLRNDPAWPGAMVDVAGHPVTVVVERATPDMWIVRARATGGRGVEARLEARRGLPAVATWRDLP